MNLNASPTELTTAATNAALALMSIALAVLVCRIGTSDRFRSLIWAWLFGLMAAAAGWGAVVHAMEWPPSVRVVLWHPLYLALGLLVSLFIVAVVRDLRGEYRAKQLLPFTVMAGFGFWGITLAVPGSFAVFIVYEAAAMVFALGGYVLLFRRGRLPGAGWMAAGILVTIVAAGVQAGGRTSFTFIWPFDHNGAYHLIQMAAMPLFLAGLQKSMR
jgi:hypothetical protein